MATIGVISPGEMGGAIAAALVRRGIRAVSTVAGRSERTHELARARGIELLGDLDAVCDVADAVLSVVPPQHADAVGRLLRGRARLWADLNAISPPAVRALGCDVDGAISGPPPDPGAHRQTQLFLSGPRADELAALLGFGPEVAVTVVGPQLGQASAVKMSTASVRKGRTAILVQALRAAEANGVLEHVLADLTAFTAGAGHLVATSVAKSERFAAEMREIAATQEAVGLTPALFEGIARVWDELEQTAGARERPEEIPADRTLAQTLATLRPPR